MIKFYGIDGGTVEVGVRFKIGTPRIGEALKASKRLEDLRS
jgi:hypothetical protein